MNFLCYLNDEKATAAAITPDGWYRSGTARIASRIRTDTSVGDVGKTDKLGNVFIVDRLKDVIKYKGTRLDTRPSQANQHSRLAGRSSGT